MEVMEASTSTNNGSFRHFHRSFRYFHLLPLKLTFTSVEASMYNNTSIYVVLSCELPPASFHENVKILCKGGGGGTSIIHHYY